MKKTGCILLAAASLAAGAMGVAGEENPVIVTVNGEDICQSELEDMVSALNDRMSLYGIDTGDEEVAKTIRESALEELVDDRLLTQDMTARGCYEFSREEEELAASSAQTALENLTAQYTAYFTEYLAGEEDGGMTGADLAQTYLQEHNYTLEYMENYYRNALASEKYEEWMMDGEPEITEEQIQEAYAQRVEESRDAYETDISAFETALQNGQEVWYRPEGYRAVLQIMLSAEGETEEEKLESVKEKTEDIYARLEKGEAFETLIGEYGEDTAFESQSFLETGYQVHRESVIWEEAFVEAAFGEEMKEAGDYTQPLVFDDHVHILYYLKDVPAGQAELTEELKEALKSELYEEQAEERLKERLEELKEEAEILYAEE